MKQITAAKFGICQIIDLDGAVLGTLTTSKDSRNRTSFILNGRRAGHSTIWSAMHSWADRITEQNTRNYKARMAGVK
jgi:6-phosphofructokinase